MDLNTLPRWQCHKIVRAARIVAIDDGVICRLGLRAGLQGSEAVWHDVAAEWAEKHKPEIGGFVVAYDDGYVSFSPARAFEEGYTLMDRLGDYSKAEIPNDKE